MDGIAAAGHGDRRLDPWPTGRSIGSSVDYPLGTTLFRQGQRVDHLYLVTNGVVKLSRSERDRERIVALRFPCWLVGAEATILELPHPVSAVTASPCRATPLSRAAFLDLVASDRLVTAWFHRMSAREIYEQAILLASFGGRQTKTRLSRLLVELARAGHSLTPGAAIVAHVRLTHEELGQCVGATRECVGRTLAELERAGRIQRVAGCVQIPDSSPWSRLVRAV